jgi:hypothetical protein
MSASFDWTYNLLDEIKDFFHSVNDYDKALNIEIQFAFVYYREKNSFFDLIEYIKSEQLKNFEKRFYALKGMSKEETENFFYMTILFLNQILDFKFSSEECKVEFLKSTIKVFDNCVSNDLADFDWKKIIAVHHVIKIINTLSQYNLATPLSTRTTLNIEELKKIQEDKLESNAKYNAKFIEALPDLVIPNNLNKKKILVIKINHLRKLADNNYIKESKDFFNSLSIEIGNLGNSFFRNSIYF